MIHKQLEMLWIHFVLQNQFVKKHIISKEGCACFCVWPFACGVYAKHIYTHKRICECHLHNDTFRLLSKSKISLGYSLVNTLYHTHTRACHRITASAKIAPFALSVVIAVSTIDLPAR